MQSLDEWFRVTEALHEAKTGHYPGRLIPESVLLSTLQTPWGNVCDASLNLSRFRCVPQGNEISSETCALSAELETDTCSQVVFPITHF